jgi:CheY-like chemotaxis protein
MDVNMPVMNGLDIKPAIFKPPGGHRALISQRLTLSPAKPR